jgi:polar amino acid transport system substrate-binding protein
MRFFSHKGKVRRVSTPMLFSGVLVVLMLVLAACGSTSTATNSNPLNLITPGTLTVGSDTTYPPQEYVDTSTGKYVGFDIDLITAVAQQMGLKVNVVKADFSTIIDSLVAKRFDVVISAVTINSDREKKVNFVPYFNAGESLLVPKGNPKNLTKIENACGLNIGVQKGTVEQDDATAADTACKKAGKSGINITALDNQTDVVQLLVNHRVDATYQDSPVTDYYLAQNAGQFEVGGDVVNAAPEGIAVAKSNTSLFNSLKDAFAKVKSSGKYDQLFSQWHLSDSQKISYLDRRNEAVA